jgi:hypothetical protein
LLSSEHQSIGNNVFRNDGSFLEQFNKSQGHLPSTYGTDYPPINSLQSFGPPWFPPPMFDQRGPPPFSLHPPPFNTRKKNFFYYRKKDLIVILLAQLPPPPFNAPSAFFPLPSSNSSGFLSPPFLPPPPTASFPLPPPEFLSKMLQTPPPPLPVPAPLNNSSTINNEDLYDPLQAEDDDEEDVEQAKSPIQKSIHRTFNVKKEFTIKIEPSMSSKHFIQNEYLFFRSININKSNS